MTMKQIMLATMALGMIGNNVLAEKKKPKKHKWELPTVVFMDPYFTHINLDSEKFSELSQKEYPGGFKVCKENKQIVYYCKTYHSNPLLHSSYLTYAKHRFFEDMDEKGQLEKSELPSDFNLSNIQSSFPLYFMTDRLKDEMQDKEFNSTEVDLDAGKQRRVRVFYPKEIEKSNVQFYLQMTINNLLIDRATIENIHDALDATIE